MYTRGLGLAAVWAGWLFLVVGLSSSAARAGENASASELVIFVGKLAEVQELNYDCGQGCWNFDSGYRLTYSVVKTLSGEAGRQEESFDFFGHYGLPAFTHYDTALLFVFKGKEANVMARYLAFPVARTDDGNWAFCGDPYPEDIPRSDRPDFRRVSFEVPVASSSITAGYRDDGSWSGWFDGMKPGLKRCRRAALVADMVAYFRSRAEPGYNRVYLFSTPEGREQQRE